MDIQIETIEAMPVACIRHTGPYPEMSQVWETLMGWVAQKGLMGTDAAMLGLYWDDPFETPGPDLIREIAAGRYVTAVHLGPFDTLSDTYAAMTTWGVDQGVTFREHPTIEMYLSDPETTPPEKFQTKLFVAIE